MSRANTTKELAVSEKLNEECVICKHPIGVKDNGGHNAEPVAEGQCCGDCNWYHVVPARWKRIRRIVNRRE